MQREHVGQRAPEPLAVGRRLDEAGQRPAGLRHHVGERRVAHVEVPQRGAGTDARRPLSVHRQPGDELECLRSLEAGRPAVVVDDVDRTEQADHQRPRRCGRSRSPSRRRRPPARRRRAGHPPRRGRRGARRHRRPPARPGRARVPTAPASSDRRRARSGHGASGTAAPTTTATPAARRGRRRGRWPSTRRRRPPSRPARRPAPTPRRSCGGPAARTSTAASRHWPSRRPAWRRARGRSSTDRHDMGVAVVEEGVRVDGRRR